MNPIWLLYAAGAILFLCLVIEVAVLLALSIFYSEQENDDDE